MSKCKKGCRSVRAHEKIKRLRETWLGLLLMERRKTSQLCHLGEARTWPCSFRYAEKMEGMILKILTLVENYYLREAERNFKASTSLLGRCLQLPVPVPFSKTILSVEEKRFSWALQEIYFFVTRGVFLQRISCFDFPSSEKANRNLSVQATFWRHEGVSPSWSGYQSCLLLKKFKFSGWATGNNHWRFVFIFCLLVKVACVIRKLSTMPAIINCCPERYRIRCATTNGAFLVHGHETAYPKQLCMVVQQGVKN